MILYFRISVLLILFSSDILLAQDMWVEQSTGITQTLYDIESIDINVSYASGSNGQIIKTTDSGQIWNTVPFTSSSNLFDCEFKTELIGWVCGSGGMVAGTTDGGNTWVQQSLGSMIEFYELNIFGSLLGVVAGTNTLADTAVLYFTSDGGVNWTALTAPPGLGSIVDIEFTNTTTGFAIGEYEVYYTTTGGFMWTAVTIPVSTQPIYCIEMADVNHGWICGANGAVFYTSDGGVTWVAQTTPTTNTLKTIAVIDTNTAIISGYNGTIISTSDGGITWELNIVPVTTDLMSVNAVNAGNAWSCGEGGKMVRLSPDLDLELYDYYGPSLVCPLVPFEIALSVKNIGLAPITNGTFTVLNGITPVLNYDWTGNLLPGNTDDIIVGQISVNSNAILTINFSGDDITTNNTLYEPIAINSDQPFGATGPVVSCSGEIIELSAYGGNSYYWLNASADSTNQTQTVFASGTGYIVQITQSSCILYDTVYVALTTEDCSTTAFSPNNDGVNDYFFIDFLPEGNNTVTILNRWGDEILVFHNYDNQNIHWDGSDNTNGNVPEGTYYYIVESENEGPVLKGWVQIVR